MCSPYLQPPHSLNPTEDLHGSEVPLKFTSLSSLRQNITFFPLFTFLRSGIVPTLSHPDRPLPTPHGAIWTKWTLQPQPCSRYPLLSPPAVPAGPIPHLLLFTWSVLTDGNTQTWLQLRTQSAYCLSRGTETIPFCLYLKSQSPNSLSAPRLSPPNMFTLY